MFGLVDGNNFYVSCERVFQPVLLGKPVVVLSNNDGCCIARSNEVKALGVAMGQPIHEIQDLVKQHGIQVRSANFALYGDLSGRIVSILRDLFPVVEVYSIDESFVSFDGIADLHPAAKEARTRILQWTGIPCCVGIGATKTLAKAGNKLAKKTVDGVVEVHDPEYQLARYPVGDLWGVGRRWSAKLGAEGILTAVDLMHADADTLRARYGVALARTQRDLQGMACSELIEEEPDRRQIVCSRSFGREIVEQEELSEAVATFAMRAAEKLRARALQASGVWVWCNTNPHKPDAPQYHPSRGMNFIAPTSDTRVILSVAQALLRSMWRKGYRWKKAGVGLLDLVPVDAVQTDLFAGVDVRSAKLMEVLDRANRRYGRGTLGFGASGWRPKPAWGMRQEHLSPSYTTRWDQLLKVR